MRYPTKLQQLSDWAWSRVATPKIFTAAMCAIYFILLTGWASALIEPPLSPHGVYGQITMYMVAVLVVVGSLVAIPTALTGNFRVERWAVITVGVGIGLYIASRYVLHLDDAENWVPQANTSAVSVVVMAVRLRHVWKRPVGQDEEVLVHPRSADSTS